MKCCIFVQKCLNKVAIVVQLSSFIVLFWSQLCIYLYAFPFFIIHACPHPGSTYRCFNKHQKTARKNWSECFLGGFFIPLQTHCVTCHILKFNSSSPKYSKYYTNPGIKKPFSLMQSCLLLPCVSCFVVQLFRIRKMWWRAFIRNESGCLS